MLIASGWCITILFVLFVAFSIGLNLGLHGIIVLHEAAQLSKEISGRDKSIAPGSTKPGILEEAKTVVEIVPFATVSEAVEEKQVEETQVNVDHVANIYDTVKSAEQSKNVEIAIKASKLKLSSGYDGVISKYVQNGGKIPIVLLTYNRPELLEGTIQSLLAVRGVSTREIIVMQDGALADVTNICKKYNLEVVHNMQGVHLRGGIPLDGGQRIARHFRYALSTAFDKRPDAPAVIIVEDDLILSPDFFEYFHAVAPLLELDSTLFLISAWNDNGFKGNVHDPYALQRTEFFPGLGWLLPRVLYKTELEEKWPKEHWDHWLRSPEINKYREIVYPQIPRSFHNGIKGTFMNEETHNRYFRNIAYNRDENISWKNYYVSEESPIKQETLPYMLATSDVYEARVNTLLSTQCTHIGTFQDLVESEPGKILCVWINVNPEPDWNGYQAFEIIGTFFGIWHEHKRASHRGLHEFYWEGRYILLINTWQSRRPVGEQLAKNYRAMKPENVHLIERNHFDKSQIDMLRHETINDLRVVKATSKGVNCDDACSASKYKCRPEYFQFVNSCSKMKEVFDGCACEHSFGLEQPAYIPEAKKCLLTNDVSRSQCGAKHTDTIRICPCTQE